MNRPTLTTQSIGLFKNLKHNNGNVGIWGISYPGFYAAMSLMESHPALKAVSPQAPISDWFIGDDMHHNGALTLSMSFDFFKTFDQPRDSLTTHGSRDLNMRRRTCIISF